MATPERLEGAWRRLAPALAMLAVVAIGMPVFTLATREESAAPVVDAGRPLNWHAERNNTPAGKLVRELSHEYPDARQWPLRGTPVSELPCGEDGLRAALEEMAAEDASSILTVLFFPVLALFLGVVTVLLATRNRFARWRWWVLAGSVVVFGLAVGGKPNPMESFVKLAKTTVGLEGGPLERVVVLAAFAVLAIAANKAICGWACPIGAVQDIIHRVSPLRKMQRRWRIPFWLTSGARVALFGVFLCLLFGWLFGVDKYVVYHNLNIFHVFDWTLSTGAVILLPIVLVTSLLWYRPYCHFICPFGLVSWLLESLSWSRPRVVADRCTRCQACVRACPSLAAHARINGSGRTALLPDCFACGACVEACPHGAAVFAGPRADAVGALPPASTDE